MKPKGNKSPQKDVPKPFPFLFVESEAEPPIRTDSFDPMEIVAQIGGKLQPTGQRDKIIVFHSVGFRDIQAEEIVAELAYRGTPVFYIDTTTFLEKCQLSIELGQSGKIPGVLKLPCGNLALDEVKSVWFRGPGIASGKIKHPKGSMGDFIAREGEAVLWGVIGVLDRSFWMNHPNAVQAAQDKLTQLNRAEALGLTIPRTLITNNPQKARDFFDTCRGEIILKTFTRLAYLDNGKEYLILTNQVLSQHLRKLESVRTVPCLFQELIHKDIEIRATIVGRRLFAAEIHSQSSPISKDDYRHYDFANTVYQQHTLPQAVASACLSLLDSYGLSFGAIDLIRRPDGEYVFLEINANAQYLWVQDLTGLQIRESIADVLIQGSV